MVTMVRRWWRQPDHFYWFTAFLAAREAQSAVCRLIAVSAAGLGAVAVAMMWSPAGPQTREARFVAVAVAGCCLVMALGWSRRSWPTRAQSELFVVTAGVCIAATCLVQAEALAGLLWATAFAVLAGYIALFHTARYLAFNLAVAIATTTTVASRLAGGGYVIWAGCAAVFIAMVTFAVPAACQGVIQLLDVDVLDAEIERLTGLLNRGAFYQLASNLMARSRDGDQQLVIVVINLDNFGLLCETVGVGAGDRARVAVAQTLREVTRHNAILAHVDRDQFLIADTFTVKSTAPLIERVRTAIAATPPRLTASIGVVTTPLRGLGSYPSEDLLDELLTMGAAAMCHARRAGGNRARYVRCANPTTGGDQTTGLIDDA